MSSTVEREEFDRATKGEGSINAEMHESTNLLGDQGVERAAELTGDEHEMSPNFKSDISNEQMLEQKQQSHDECLDPSISSDVTLNK